MTKGIKSWLIAIYSMVLLMVIVGGVTRLTGSGLSMVEWRPLMGAIPPMNEAEWLDVFAKYKTSPQYALVNSWMTLADFKSIFLWEYVHRILGRLIGIVFFVPWVYFMIRKQMDKRLALQSAGLFILGGSQGLMGWYMVMSGLADRPEVSHFRLAAHLSLALVIAQLCLWLLLSSRTTSQPASSGLRKATVAFLSLVSVQVVYGAFMAGMRAGFLSATFPKMNGEWLPDAALSGDLMHDLVSNGFMVHFMHRSLGWLVFFGGIALGVALFRNGFRKAAYLVIGGVGLQFLLGIMTVMMHVAIPVAAIHQLGGALLLSVAVYLVHVAYHGKREAHSAAAASAS